MARIRVLVVDDSVTVRKYLVELIEQDPELEVVGEAFDGRHAIELCQCLRPDVVSLDIVMPGMSGVSATEYIMAYCPAPILVVSASLNRGDVYSTYEALSAGAVDVIDKLGDDSQDRAWENEYRSRLKLVSRIKVITHPRAKLARRLRPAFEPSSPPAAARPRLVALGASTGGPSALVEIVSRLPADFPLPILIVIHIGQPFGPTFAEWLNSKSPIPVIQAIDGMNLPSPGDPVVVVAPPDRHLMIQDGMLRLTDAPERHSCRPSVDVLFESVARELGPDAIACLLTGMGRDGAAGLLDIRRSGGMTIAQDEASSVVFGMPREAISLGAASEILPLERISAALVELSSGLPRGAGA